MEIVVRRGRLDKLHEAGPGGLAGPPILIDKFLEDAVEMDVDAVCDGQRRYRRHHGAHRGGRHPLRRFGLRSAALFASRQIRGRDQASNPCLAAELGVIGLINIQFAVKNNTVYILEVNPRASRTVPFVSKATGVRWQLAAKVMLGKTLAELGITEEIAPLFRRQGGGVSVRGSPGWTRSWAPRCGRPAKSWASTRISALPLPSRSAAGQSLPLCGGVLFSVKDADKPATLELAKGFQAKGFRIYATAGTAAFLQARPAGHQRAQNPGWPAHIIDHIKNNEIHLLVNTPEGRYTPADSYSIRRAALEYNIPYTTTVATTRATLDAIRAMKRGKLEVKSLQEYHAMVKKSEAKLRAVKG